MRHVVGSLVTGVVFGFVMSRVGFTNWDNVHAMFTFTSFDLLLVLVSAIVLLGVGWQVIKRLGSPGWSRRPVHKGTLAGGLLFGAGWAITGACPTTAMVQLGEGQLAAVWTIVGIIVGNALYAFIHPRVFGWSMQNCLDD